MRRERLQRVETAIAMNPAFHLDHVMKEGKGMQVLPGGRIVYEGMRLFQHQYDTFAEYQVKSIMPLLIEIKNIDRYDTHLKKYHELADYLDLGQTEAEVTYGKTLHDRKSFLSRDYEWRVQESTRYQVNDWPTGCNPYKEEERSAWEERARTALVQKMDKCPSYHNEKDWWRRMVKDPTDAALSTRFVTRSGRPVEAEGTDTIQAGLLHFPQEEATRILSELKQVAQETHDTREAAALQRLREEHGETVDALMARLSSGEVINREGCSYIEKTCLQTLWKQHRQVERVEAGTPQKSSYYAWNEQGTTHSSTEVQERVTLWLKNKETPKSIQSAGRGED